MKELLLLALAIAVGQFANSMVLPALPLIAREFAVTSNSAALLVTAYFAGFAAVGLLVGPLSDRIGRRPLLLGGLAVLMLGSLGAVMAPSFAVLLGCRLIEAAGAAGTPVLARAIVRDTRRDGELARALGILATTMSVSPVVGPILGGAVTHLLGWRALFMLLAALAAVAGLAIVSIVPETLASASIANRPSLWRKMRSLLARRRFRIGTMFGAAQYFAFGAVYTVAPFLFIDRFGLDHLEFGAIFAVISACLALGGIAGPRLLAVIAQPQLLRLGGALTVAAGLLLVALSALSIVDATSVVTAFAVFGIGLGITLSVGGGLMLEGAEDAGTASSLSGFLQIGAAALGSALAGTLHSGSVAPVSMVLLLAGLAALGAVWPLAADTLEVRATKA